MAWVAEVLDDLLGLPVTSGAVDSLEGRQCAPGDTLGRPHHPLESPAVVNGAVAVPGGDTAQQDAFNGASVVVFEVLTPSYISSAFFITLSVWMDHFRLSVMQAVELKYFHHVYCGPVNVDVGMFPLLSAEVHNQLLHFVDIVRLFSWHHSTRALTFSL